MLTFPERLRFDAMRVRDALNLEPDIRPNFAQAGTATILAVMYCLVLKGVGTASAIYRYLESRGCKFDRETIDFFLNAYDGDDPRHHMWMRGTLGDYDLIGNCDYPFDLVD